MGSQSYQEQFAIIQQAQDLGDDRIWAIEKLAAEMVSKSAELAQKHVQDTTNGLQGLDDSARQMATHIATMTAGNMIQGCRELAQKLKSASHLNALGLLDLVKQKIHETETAAQKMKYGPSDGGVAREPHMTVPPRRETKGAAVSAGAEPEPTLNISRMYLVGALQTMPWQPQRTSRGPGRLTMSSLAT